MSISQSTALFSLLGTTFGGNGQTTFNLPDLQGRTAIGIGQGAGLSAYSWGQDGGAENVTLIQSQMPIHTHTATFVGTGGGGGGGALSITLKAVQAAATLSAPAEGALFATAQDAAGADTPQIYVPAGTAGTQVALGSLAVTGSGGITGGTVTNAEAGSSQPTNIQSPYLALYYIIAINGIYPSRG